jgi:arylformamidase
MKIYDVSVQISPEMPVYPGDPGVTAEVKQSLAKGDPCNLAYYGFGSHTGTHIDAPYHFIEGGMKVNDIPMNLLIGRTLVVEFTAARIDAELLKEVNLGEHVRVIFKTRNSYLWRSNHFAEDYVYVTPDAAEVLVESGIKLVGIDYLSIEQYQSTGYKTHHTLLGNGVIIIEGLNLAEVEPGDYELICLPLKVSEGDGAPARVILRK